jgi:hypothetical protein
MKTVQKIMSNGLQSVQVCENLTNEELEKVFGENLKQVCVAAIFATKNPNFVQMLCVQKREDVSLSNANVLDTMFLGWDTGSIVRCTRNVDITKSKIKPEAGMILDKALNIRVVESTTPYFDKQTPKVKTSTGEIMTKEGQPIYRDAELVIGQPQHILIEADKVEVLKPEVPFALNNTEPIKM